jgi:hypothetical protein
MLCFSEKLLCLTVQGAVQSCLIVTLVFVAVDFPSSPKQLKECLEAHGLAMPLERDSGTAG